MQRGNKKLYLEILRIISIFLVIFNHTGSNGFFLWYISESSLFYPIYFLCSVACKIAVPIFWMISGALLIDRDESLTKVYRKRVGRIVLTVFVFSIIQYVYNVMWMHNTDDSGVGYFFRRLLTDRWATTYGFLYSYIGIMMLLPFIRKMAKNMSNREFKYLFILGVIVNGVIPMVQYLLGHGEYNLNGRIFESMFGAYMIYFMGGYYFEKRIKEEELSEKKVRLGLLAGAAAIVLTCLMTKYYMVQSGVDGESKVQYFYNSLMIVPSFAFFYAVRTWTVKAKIPEAMQKLVVILGSTVFGVMLTENIYREQLTFVFNWLKPYIHIFPACLLWVLSVCVCGSVVTLILKKIPGLKHLL